MPPTKKSAPKRTAKPKSYAPEYYIDDAGKHRWRLRADNNKIYGASHQGFSSKAKAKENFNLQGRDDSVSR